MKHKFLGLLLLGEISTREHHVACRSDLSLKALCTWRQRFHEIIVSGATEVDLVVARVNDSPVVLHSSEAK